MNEASKGLSGVLAADRGGWERYVVEKSGGSADRGDMSSGAAGKFQDHYIILGVESNADSETIQAAYSKLAQKFHPNRGETPDQTKFDAVNQAYEVLADPALRLAFDQVKGIDRDAGNPKFSGAEFFHALEQSEALRSAILCILYDRRRLKALKPSLGLRQLEGMLAVTLEEMNFALWYLKQRSLVVNDDKSSMAITVEGMDYLEKNMPSADEVAKFIKSEALTNPPQTAKSGGPVLNALSKALQRNAPDDSQTRVALRPK